MIKHREIFQNELLFRMCFYTRLLRHRGHALVSEAAPWQRWPSTPNLGKCEVRLWSGFKQHLWRSKDTFPFLCERVGDVGTALSYHPAPNRGAAHVLHHSDTYESLVAASFIKHALAKGPEYWQHPIYRHDRLLFSFSAAVLLPVYHSAADRRVKQPIFPIPTLSPMLLMFRGDTVLLGSCLLWCNAGVFSLLEPESKCKWKRFQIQVVLLWDNYQAQISLVHRW